MAIKPKPPPDDPEQSARFVETAKALGGATEAVFSRAVKMIVPAQKRLRKRARKIIKR